MDDVALAVALMQVSELERQARAHMAASRAEPAQLPELDNAVVVMRLVTPLKRALEGWISTRACRAALPQSSTGGRHVSR